jgi:hypothetical protein
MIPENLPQNTYSVAIHLVDDAGTLVSQADFPLPSRFYDCTMATIPLEDVPPGDYTVRALVYNWQSNERLLSGEQDFVEVRTVRVVED